MKQTALMLSGNYSPTPFILPPSLTDMHRPGSSLHYIEVIENPRYEDFNFKYDGVSLPFPLCYAMDK